MFAKSIKLMILASMRFSIDLDDDVLGELLELTGSRKRSPAVVQAVEDYVRRQKMRNLGRAIRRGAFADAFEPDYDPDSPSCFRAPDPNFLYSNIRKENKSFVLSEPPPPAYGEAKKQTPTVPTAPVASVAPAVPAAPAATPDPKADSKDANDPR
jgi:Arc/MetJ family transcription regulator